MIVYSGSVRLFRLVAGSVCSLVTQTYIFIFLSYYWQLSFGLPGSKRSHGIW